MKTEQRPGAPEIAGLKMVKLLGSGGYADVYLYEQAMPKMRVAVKVLSSSGLSEAVMNRFTAEANAMAELADHPYIVQVFRADVADDGRPYLVMKYYPQRNLAARAKAEKISVPEVLAIGVRIASAVETAHRAGILHRDIKPANILTSQYGEPGLTDFGIASTKQDGSEESDGMSIPWAAPEVVFGNLPADERSDVYSLGATIWHLLVGRSPFEIPGGDNSSLAMVRRVREQPPPRTGREDVPAELERLLAQTMAKDPSSRPSTALELAKSLQQIEIANRWNPTPLVVLDDSGSEVVELPRRDDGLDGIPEDRTRLKGAQRIAAQQPVFEAPVQEEERTRRRSVISSGQVATPGDRRASDPVQPRARVGMPEEPPAEGTVRRVAASTEAAPATAAQQAPARGGRRTGIVLAAVVGVLLVGSAAAILLSAKGHARTPTAQSIPTTIAALDTQIGVPYVKVAVSGTTAEISWTYSNAQAGDKYRVQVNGGAWIYPASTHVSVPVTSGTSVCAVVQVERSDGSATSPISSPVCSG